MRTILYIIFLYILSLIGQTGIINNTQLPISFFFDKSIDTLFAFNLDSIDETKIYSDFYYNQIYFEKSKSRVLNDIGNWHSLLGFKKEIKVFNTPILLNSSYSKNKKFLISNNKHTAYKYIQNYQRFNLSVYTALNIFHFKTGINIYQFNLKTEVYPSLNIGLSLFNKLCLGYGFETNQNNWQFSAVDSDEIFDFEQREYRETNKFNLIVIPKKGLIFKGTYNWSKLNPKMKPEENINMIAAKGKSSQIFLESQFSHVLGFDKIDFNFQDFNLNADGYFYSDKEIFGQVTNKTAGYTNYNISLTNRFKKSVLESSFSLGETYINTRGYADTWPFSDFWTDLLGLRYLADEKMQYDFFSGSFNFKNYFTENSFYKIMIMYEQIQPTGKLKTWQPDFLVFGIKNLQTSIIDIIRQHGLYFRGEVFYTFLKKISLGYQLSQYIPVYIEKTDKDIEQKSKTSDKKFKYGGGQHSIKLQIDL